MKLHETTRSSVALHKISNCPSGSDATAQHPYSDLKYLPIINNFGSKGHRI